MLRPERFPHVICILLSHIRLEKHLQSQFPGFASSPHISRGNGHFVRVEDTATLSVCSVSLLQGQFTSERNYRRFFAERFFSLLSLRVREPPFRAEREMPFVLTVEGGWLTASFSDAISTAASAASNPLFPIFRPARSIACSRVSQVNTPKAWGTPVSWAD